MTLSINSYIGLLFYLYIYESKRSNQNAWYYPQTAGGRVKEVVAYFSILHPEQPLVLGFKTHGFSEVQYLKYTDFIGKTFNGLPEDSFLHTELDQKLQEEDQNLNKKLLFHSGSGYNRCIKQLPRDGGKTEYVGSSKNFKKVTFIANTQKEDGGDPFGPWTLYSDKLLKQSANVTNKIESSNLNGITPLQYHNIIVYYRCSDDMVLLIELVEDFTNRKYLVRKDIESEYWKEEQKDYAKSGLESRLTETNYKLGQLTYRIDHTRSYDYVTVLEITDDQESGFKKYRHQANFKSVTKSIITLKGRQLKDKEDQPINKLNNKICKTITVYQDNKDTILLIELENLETKQKDCYKHVKETSKDYWEKVEANEDNSKLKELLRSTRFEFLDSILILLDKQSDYSHGDAKYLSSVDTLNIIRDKTISVEHHQSRGICIASFGYKVCKHNIYETPGSNSNIGLRFCIPQFNGDYKEIILDDKDKNTEYIYYQPSMNDVYVYFYGSDPRPLLFCYKDASYKPSSPSNYTKKWVKINEITSCTCGPEGETLKRKLDEITEELNLVNIYNFLDYSVQEHYQPSIKIRVTSDELKCYTKHSHLHIEGHRFGKTFYNSVSNQVIKETKYTNQLYVYYYTHDLDRIYPLLVEIEVKDSISTINKEYYELTEANYDYKWSKWAGLDQLTGDEQLKEKTEKLLEKLFELNKQFNGKDTKNPPKESECMDVKIDITTILAATIPTAGITGGCIAACVFRETIATFLKSFVKVA